VTHQVQYLEFADKILVLNSYGKQSFYGTFAEFKVCNMEESDFIERNEETNPTTEINSSSTKYDCRWMEKNKREPFFGSY
jgi:hypothetical protein